MMEDKHERRERENHAHAQKMDNVALSLRKTAIQVIMESEAGRAYIWWLLESTEVDQQPFEMNALKTSFNCGKQWIGQRIKEDLHEHCLDNYFVMLKERQHKELENENHE